MNLRKTLLAASIAALPVMATVPAHAATPLMAAPVQQLSPQESAALVAKLAARSSKLGLDAGHGYAISSQHPGVAGTKISRAQHTFQGLRVFGSETVVVSNAAGDIVSESVADRRAGLGNNAAKSADGAANARFETTPAISGIAAIDLVVKAVAPRATHFVAPTAELLVYPVMKSVRVSGAADKSEAALNALDLEEVVDRYELAYLVQTRMVSGNKPIYFDSVVSAKDGSVLAQWKALKTVIGVGNSQYNGTVPVSTTFSNGVYSMKDPVRGTGGTYGAMAITNANHGTSAGSVYTNPTNTWGDGQQYNGGSTTDANGQTAAVNALWGLMNTYDMLKNVLGWNSLDGNNTSTYIAAHVNTAYDNAYYDDNCKCMFIGDGSNFNSLGAIDVIGHEMSHGVTAATSDLVYSGESGGLNESHSDIGGEAVEAYARAGGTGNTLPNTGNDWMTGKEISKTGQPLRWLFKPSKDGKSPNAWSSTIKNLDVHYSSGPNNRMFYFLSQGSNASSGSDYYSSYLNKSPLAMTGIGTDKAFRIWFKALTTKFTSSTNYADARNKVLLAAEELYGVGSAEATAVKRAYAAINVGADVDETSTGGAVTITSQPASITVAPGGNASFAVGAGGGTAPYSYQWYRNGAAIAGATASGYAFTAQAADNGAVFKASVTDASSPAVTVSSANATLTVSNNSSSELITNGGFEDGATGWSGNTGAIGDQAGQSPYEGSKFAWLGGNGKTSTETLSQSVTIPASATSATLSFALHIDTAETGTTVYDRLRVTVKNAAGTVLGTLATYSNVNPASGYQIRTFNLLAYKGQTVQISFAATEDASLQTSFVVDKVSLIAQ
ncbi:M4 family metallopeptidase [Janthinobacterium fluminis]|uniref:M4 family metallopeptidase n=1 Tax=Janthinobacterium fluminis TaxID=2987524 RepID=A0ABT5K0Z3_9BURK|nr:M4 family metallopeptidase [Janthinobacterium fluminis]MDC8758648.1 M4 family metallopeptidase [Janthinobacterium fluminis]